MKLFTNIKKQKDTLKCSLLYMKKKKQFLQVNKSRVIRIKNEKFSGQHFYANMNL